MRGGWQGDFGCFMFVIISRNDFMLSTWQVTRDCLLARQVPPGPMHQEVSMICYYANEGG